jgi:glycosyltransferase involved in cell wall biosynthesis
MPSRRRRTPSPPGCLLVGIIAETMVTVSIVVRALDEAEHLPALYTGLLRQSRQPDEIILVDSGSTDDTVAISEAHGALVEHITPAEFSFGRSLNRGCAKATGDLLVFVSAHVYPLDEKWLERLVAPFDDPAVGLVYGRQTGDHRSRFSELEVLRRWFPLVANDDQRDPFCNNANCAVRAVAWRDLPYDETLTGLEDLDWAKRALVAGWRVVYEPAAAIAHVHEESYGQVRNRYRREAIAHRQIFQDQHMGLTGALGLFLLSVGRDYLAAVPRRRLIRNLGSIPAFRGAQYFGTWEGFRHRGEVSSALRRRFYYPKGFRALSRSTKEPRS